VQDRPPPGCGARDLQQPETQAATRVNCRIAGLQDGEIAKRRDWTTFSLQFAIVNLRFCGLEILQSKILQS
jgi:hypothetical protein